jgi:hypothetical protein
MCPLDSKKCGLNSHGLYPIIILSLFVFRKYQLQTLYGLLDSLAMDHHNLCFAPNECPESVTNYVQNS